MRSAIALPRNATADSCSFSPIIQVAIMPVAPVILVVPPPTKPTREGRHQGVQWGPATETFVASHLGRCHPMAKTPCAPVGVAGEALWKEQRIRTCRLSEFQFCAPTFTNGLTYLGKVR